MLKKVLSKLFICLFLIFGTIGFIFVVTKTFPDDMSALSGKESTKKQSETVPIQKVSPKISQNQMYVGVYIDNPYAVQKVYKNSVNTAGWFVDLDDPVSYDSKLELGMDEHMYTPFITLEPSNMALDDIANGVYDDRFNEFFSKLTEGDRINTDVFVRFAHEMEMRPSYGDGAWYSWQSDDSEAYVRAWQHVIDLGHAQAPNIKWVWSPNRADIYTESYYPGDEYVDYVGLSLNNPVDDFDKFEDYYTQVGTKEHLESYNKPIIISECAKSGESEKFKTKYMKSIFDYIEKDPKICGVVFFEKDVDDHRQYKFSDNPKQLKLFIKNAKKLLKKDPSEAYYAN